MFNIGYFKGQPTEYVLKYSGGRVTAEGPGLAFFYLRYRTQVVAVPAASGDAPFVFQETTADFQTVTVQGNITYRVADPRRLADRLNFAIDPATRRYLSTDPDKLPARLSNAVQIETRAAIQAKPLADVLREATPLATAVRDRVRQQGGPADLGVEVLAVDFLSLRPTPEVGQALEAEAREALLRKADDATFARRAAAVEAERTIKEKELATDRALEEQRKELIHAQGANAKQQAQNRAEALDILAAARARATAADLAAYRDLDPRAVLAVGLKKLGDDANKVGHLTITPDLLASVLRPGG
jgi:regulator of protease activity HflC (stomatin/prohibitin superfamily)